MNNRSRKMVVRNDNIDFEDLERMYNMRKREQEISKKFDLDKIKYREDKKLYYIYIDRKPISAKTYDKLIDKLHEMYVAEKENLQNYYYVWKKYKEENTAITKKTMKIYQDYYETYLEGNEIAKIPLVELRPKHFILYFQELTKNRTLTKKEFTNIKSFLNGIVDCAILNEVIERNYIHDVNCKNLPFKAANAVVIPYTEFERKRILNYLKDSDDLVDLAICFDFYFTIRIGEIKGLKWSDIHGDFLAVSRFVNEDNEIVDHVKGNADEGIRNLYIKKEAKEILEKIKSLGYDKEFIFFWDGHNFSTCTFNRHLKKVCDELGIEYRSSHKVRFSTASIMNKNGVTETELQQMLGHTTKAMTHHYLRNVSGLEETITKINNIL